MRSRFLSSLRADSYHDTAILSELNAPSSDASAHGYRKLSLRAERSDNRRYSVPTRSTLVLQIINLFYNRYPFPLNLYPKTSCHPVRKGNTLGMIALAPQRMWQSVFQLMHSSLCCKLIVSSTLRHFQIPSSSNVVTSFKRRYLSS